jgi:hypothetical protein
MIDRWEGEEHHDEEDTDRITWQERRRIEQRKLVKKEELAQRNKEALGWVVGAKQSVL